MRNARSPIFATAYKGKLYVCGGCEEQSMEIYDPIVDSWSDGQMSPKASDSWIQGCTFSSKLVYQN